MVSQASRLGQGVGGAVSTTIQVGAKLQAVEKFKQLAYTLASSQNAVIKFGRSLLVSTGILTLATQALKLLTSPLAQIGALVGTGAASIQWQRFVRASAMATNGLRAMGLTADQARNSVARLRTEFGLVVSTGIMEIGGAGLAQHLDDSTRDSLTDLTKMARRRMGADPYQFYKAGALALQPGAHGDLALQWLQALQDSTQVFTDMEWRKIQSNKMIPGSAFGNVEGPSRELTGQNVMEVYRHAMEDMDDILMVLLEEEGERLMNILTGELGPWSDIPMAITLSVSRAVNDGLENVVDTLKTPGETVEGVFLFQRGLTQFLADSMAGSMVLGESELDRINASFEENVMGSLMGEKGLASVLSGDEMAGLIAGWAVGKRAGVAKGVSTYALTSELVEQFGYAVDAIQEGDLTLAFDNNAGLVFSGLGAYMGAKVGQGLTPASVGNAVKWTIGPGLTKPIQAQIDTQLARHKFNFTISGAITGLYIGEITEELIGPEKADEIANMVLGGSIGAAFAKGFKQKIGAGLTGALVGGELLDPLLEGDMEQLMEGFEGLVDLGATLGGMFVGGKAFATGKGTTRVVTGAAGGFIGSILAAGIASHIFDALQHPERYANQSAGAKAMTIGTWAGLGAMIGTTFGGAFGAAAGAIIGGVIGLASTAWAEQQGKAEIANYALLHGPFMEEYGSFRRSQQAQGITRIPNFQQWIGDNNEVMERALVHMQVSREKRMREEWSRARADIYGEGQDVWTQGDYNRTISDEGYYIPPTAGRGSWAQAFEGGEVTIKLVIDGREIRPVIVDVVSKELEGQQVPYLGGSGG